MPDNLAEKIKREAYLIGFRFCGIAKARALTEDAKRLERWLHNGYHGDMTYMENYFDLRIDPQKLMPGAKSVISLALNYFPEKKPNQNELKISKYAWGLDYHKVIKKKLKLFLIKIQEIIGLFEARLLVDSAPILEKSWAKEAGLGWIGKHGNVITKQQGSYFFLAQLIVDVVLPYDAPYIKDYCGTCTRCIDACPTQAILPNKVIKANQCISYFTIELKSNFEKKLETNFDNWMFGCDVCMDVCPWNKFSNPHQTLEFEPIPELLQMTARDWLDITNEVFVEKFGKTSLKRAGLKNLQRNIIQIYPTITNKNEHEELM
ncbi:MAG: tRNA epoxyqueuosine(34) reductase QueG [Alphaproteobacteria bacterium]|nr:tRNA epoxyqueuosine(34) reductase QueG [Alphaproteobacteria bacterium]